jgi:hypothetical protein
MPVGHYPLQDLEIQFETFVVRELLRDTEDIYCSSSILVCSSSRGTLNSHRGVTLRACSSLSSRFEHELHVYNRVANPQESDGFCILKLREKEGDVFLAARRHVTRVEPIGH